MADSGTHKKGEITFSELLKNFKKDLGEEIGAISSFIGVVRKKSKKDGKVKKLHYESAENVEQELKEVAEEVERDIDGVSKIHIHHIIDDLEPGEEIIYVLVNGAHRDEAFQALPTVMDKVKSEVRIWKKESTEDDDYWIHEADE